MPRDRDYIRGGENNDVLLFRLMYFQGDGNNCTCIFQRAENCYKNSHLTVNCQASIWFCPIVRKKLSIVSGDFQQKECSTEIPKYLIVAEIMGSNWVWSHRI